MKDFKVINDRPSIVIVNTPAIDVNRLEGEFYKYDYLNAIDKIKKIRFLPLENLVDDIKDGPGGWDINISDYVEQGVPMLRTINIVDGLVNLDECVFIDIEKHKQLKRSRVVKNDVLLSVRGTIGKSAVYSKNFEANINAALVKITLKDNIIDPYFLVAFFNCKYGRLQTERIANGAVQLNMNLTEAKSNLIPIPSPEIQKYIGDKVRKAEELREEAKRLKKEAEEILNKELNLKDVEFYIKQTNNKKYSWTESIEIEDRIDSEFYKPKYRYLSKLNNMSELSYYYKISKKRINKNIDRKIKYIDLSSVNNIIEPSDFNTKELPSRAQFLVKEGNLIISTLKGSNKISIIPEHLNDSVCSTGFIVIASKSHLTTEYLYLVFSNKVFNMQIERYSTGSIMSGVNHDNFNKMLIPVISNKQIIDTITNKIRKHFRLLYYSKQLIQEAKQDVEDLIEGNFDMSKVKANN